MNRVNQASHLAYQFDIAVIGAGIVGLATARAIHQRFPTARCAVFEKEAQVAQHQTGHNSGVVHSGIYYPPGSLKAELCVRGRSALLAYCEAHDIPFKPVGKLIVATTPNELPALQTLYQRGLANAVPDIRWVEAEGIPAIEPHVAGIAAIHCPHTGILDYAQVCRAIATELTDAGVTVRRATAVQRVEANADGIMIATSTGAVRVPYLINCAGLFSDVLARQLLPHVDVQIIPFRGEYYRVRDPSFVRGLIYPVPDPTFPFLGVHLTRMMDGGLEAGPNAVLGYAREGYTKGTIRLREVGEYLRFPGMWQIARRYWRTGLYEIYRSYHRPAFLKAIQRLVPAIGAADIEPGGAGVRAQAVRRDGTLVDDFAFATTMHSFHVLNAPSPAATASFAIGAYIAERAAPTIEQALVTHR